MQHKIDDYNAEKHDMLLCMTVKNPYATYISTGEKKYEIRTKPTKFRGLVLITSSQKPVEEVDCNEMINGCAMCLVSITDCIPVCNLTPEEWEQTKIGESQDKYHMHYAYKLENPHRVIEVPVTGQLGMWRGVFDKDYIQTYPEKIHLDKSIEELREMSNVKASWKERILNGYFSKSKRIIRKAKWKMFWSFVKMAWPMFLLILLFIVLIIILIIRIATK